MTNYHINSNNDEYNDNNCSGDNININKDHNFAETEAWKKYARFYKTYIYNLIPAFYREYDKDGILKAFLDNIANQAAILRMDIENLGHNFFIDSCDDWVIPYIADLISAKIIPDASPQANRLTVKNMIKWRKLKGTITGLENVINNTIMRKCTLKESFESLSFSESLALSNNTVSRNTFVDLKNQNSPSSIDTSNDSLQSAVDKSDYTGKKNTQDLKNLLVFLPRLKVFHLNDAEIQREDDQKYYFRNIIRNGLPKYNNYFPLYDLKNGIKINSLEFAQNPFEYFGKYDGMSVKIKGLLAACSFKPVYLEVEPKEKLNDNLVTIIESRSDFDELDPDFVGLDSKEGITLLEPSKFNDFAKQCIIRVYSYSAAKTLVEIGNYDLSTMHFSSFKFDLAHLQHICIGNLLLSVEIIKNTNNDVNNIITFPETIISIKDSQIPLVRKDGFSINKDSMVSKYKNALYVYLPSFTLEPNKKKYFFIDNDGSTFDAKEDSCNIKTRIVKLVPWKLARASCGQIYPPCLLTFSNRPIIDFTELNRYQGIELADSGKSHEGYCIEAIALNKEKKTAWKIGRLEIESDYSNNSNKIKTNYINEKEVWLKWNLKQLNFCWENIPSCNDETKRLLEYIEKYYLKANIHESKYSVEKVGKEVWLKWNLKQLNFCWENIPSCNDETKRLLEYIEKYYLKFHDKDGFIEYIYEEISTDDDDDHYFNDNYNSDIVNGICDFIELIRIYNDQNKNFYILLNKRQQQAVLYFENNKLFEFNVQTEDKKTNIYSKISPLKPSHFKAVRLQTEGFKLQEDLIITSGINTSIIKKHQEDTIKKIVEDLLINSINQKRIKIKRVEKVEGGDFYGKNNTFEFEIDILLDTETTDVTTVPEIVEEIKNSIKNCCLFANEGDLVLRILRTSFDDVVFPLCELILTNSSGKSALVYLPQIILNKAKPQYDIYVASDGSTAFDSTLSTVARLSAGQVIPMYGRYPLRQRVPAFVNLSDWQYTDKILLGQVAIDPEHGRFAFSHEEDTNNIKNNVTADYNYAFSADIGSGTFERRATLKSSNIWISKKGHVPYDVTLPSRTFKTISQAFYYLNSKYNYDIYNSLVIQIDDSSIYKENFALNISNKINQFTFQAANHCIPTLELEETSQLTLKLDCLIENINFNGLTITGGPLSIHSSFDNLKMISCTLDPGFEGKNFVGLQTHCCTDVNSREKISSKTIFFSKTIIGSLELDHSISHLKVEDSIIENQSGLAINLKSNCENTNKKHQKNKFKFQVARSNILNRYGDPYVLEVNTIYCTDSILTLKIKVMDDNVDSCIRFSRFEEGSIFKRRLTKESQEKIDFQFKCTSVDKPIFISTDFLNSNYLHLDSSTSKEILEGAENDLEMGVFNKNAYPQMMRNLKMRMREFIPIGITSDILEID